jgi:hypothetical protein
MLQLVGKDLTMAENLLEKVKVFYDQNGQPQEVLMSYELFQQIEAILQAIEAGQEYFWTEAWQARIQEAEADIAAGRIKQVASDDTLETALEWLDE